MITVQYMRVVTTMPYEDHGKISMHLRAQPVINAVDYTFEGYSLFAVMHKNLLIEGKQFDFDIGSWTLEGRR